MPTLREVQEQFVSSLASGDHRVLARWVENGAISAADRIGVHQDNSDGALGNVLKLTYPAVEALVGGAFFAQAARAFSRSRPPRSSLLTSYGAEFGEFLASHPPTAAVAYLGEVARLEWAIAQAAASPQGWSEYRHVLGGVTVSLARSLALVSVRRSAAPIWRAVLAGDETALALIVADDTPVTVAVWRAGAGADMAELSPAADMFVTALLAQDDIENALARVAAHTDDPIRTITDEVLRADFIRIQPAGPASDGGSR